MCTGRTEYWRVSRQIYEVIMKPRGHWSVPTLSPVVSTEADRLRARRARSRYSLLIWLAGSLLVCTFVMAVWILEISPNWHDYWRSGGLEIGEPTR